MKGGLRQDEPHREGAARQALAIGAVARVDQLRSFGDLVADLAALAAAALGKFHRDVLFMWPLLVPVRQRQPRRAVRGHPRPTGLAAYATIVGAYDIGGGRDTVQSWKSRSSKS